jgi:hypothetical protein
MVKSRNLSQEPTKASPSTLFALWLLDNNIQFVLSDLRTLLFHG